MLAAKAAAADRSSDRKVLFAGLVVAAMAAAMLLTFFMERTEVLEHDSYVLTVVEIAAAIIIFSATAFAAPLALREMSQRREATMGALEAQLQVELLFKMTDMLQSALGYPDANAVLRSTAIKLLPGLGGALYVFNNSGDRLELSTAWAWSDKAAPTDAILPSQCWALKRGKTHLNQPGLEALICDHHAQESLVLEIPMMARGEVYGLLNIQASGNDAEARLLSTTPVAVALSEAMSLALSNIALRDRLRTQALRDPLTGLYKTWPCTWRRGFDRSRLGHRRSDPSMRCRVPLWRRGIGRAPARLPDGRSTDQGRNAARSDRATLGKPWNKHQRVIRRRDAARYIIEGREHHRRCRRRIIPCQVRGAEPGCRCCRPPAPGRRPAFRIRSCLMCDDDPSQR